MPLGALPYAPFGPSARVRVGVRARVPILSRVATTLGVAALASLLPAPGAAQVTLSEAHERIDFLIGDWLVTSEFPDGRRGEGALRYAWVLDGAWMRVEFRGEAPGVALWEAHVLQRWDPEAEAYESWVFAADGPPLQYRGTLPAPGWYRIEHTAPDGTTAGIDYHRQDDDTVYQENWAVSNGERRVTLRTHYRRAGESEPGNPQR